MSQDDLFSPELAQLLAKQPCDSLLLEANNEAWFSNQLAWLLDPKGSHGLGVAFVDAFLRRIARERSATRQGRESSRFKADKEGEGTEVIGFQLENCSIFREFFLSHTVKRADSALFCDILLADLDIQEGFVVVIENKLFTADRKEQLYLYEKCVADKFDQARMREFVYLTLHGSACANATSDADWVKLGWLTDLRELLAGCAERCEEAKVPVAPRVRDLMVLLDWLRKLSDFVADKKARGENNSTFQRKFEDIAREMLLAELKRLKGDKVGNWTRNHNRTALKHSSRSGSELKIGFASDLVVTVQGCKNHGGKAEFEKVLIPLGAHPDQTCNLVELAARDIYRLFFKGAKDAQRYVTDLERSGSHPLDAATKRKLADIYAHRHSLPLLLKMYRHLAVEKTAKA